MKAYYYLIYIQYLGFRYHGWQKQPKHKTIHFMVDKTLEYVFEHADFKTIGSSRTDAKVSANQSAFELFTQEPIDFDWFMERFNSNLPSDIRALSIQEVSERFNIIQTPKVKEYAYFFCYAEKPHPFSAALITHFKGELDIPLMEEGARLFEGKHNFKNYCSKPSENTIFVRTIARCFIAKNDIYTANFFPEESYILHLHGQGFLRYQVRLIMAQLIRLGRHEISLEFIRESLTGESEDQVIEIAPSSGLMLNKIIFTELKEAH